MDPDVPVYKDQYVGVVCVPANEYRSKLEVYDANSPVFLELVAEELAQIEEKEKIFGGKAR